MLGGGRQGAAETWCAGRDEEECGNGCRVGQAVQDAAAVVLRE